MKASINRFFRWPAAVLVCLTALLLTGCSRETVNYQIAEAIGTVGVYENGEPVETPRMKEEREQREEQEAEEAAFQEELGAANRLAASYYYDEAIEALEKIERTELTSQRIDEAIEACRTRAGSLRTYEGDIPHLCFPTLIADPSRAFDGDSMAGSYAGSMITTTEFTRILESLLERDYILVDIHNVARLETDSRGLTTMEMQPLKLPEGKKPVIISQDNVTYDGVVNGDGIATKLCLDDEGAVKALYTDEGGHDLKGEYDLVPIMEAFIEEHPEFSYKGARGIVSVSASKGVFGYAVTDTAVAVNDKNRETVSSIAQALLDGGWHIACAGYDHGYMNDLSPDSLLQNIEQWEEEAGSLTGLTDILFYPYGAEVEYPSDQLDVLLQHGLVYLCGLWGDTDFMEQGEGYIRQTRRFIDGYSLTNAGSYFTNFFDASAVIDSER